MCRQAHRLINELAHFYVSQLVDRGGRQGKEGSCGGRKVRLVAMRAFFFYFTGKFLFLSREHVSLDLCRGDGGG